jgi:hypothetical protein
MVANTNLNNISALLKIIVKYMPCPVEVRFNVEVAYHQ